jgi:hypothetical protein
VEQDEAEQLEAAIQASIQDLGAEPLAADDRTQNNDKNFVNLVDDEDENKSVHDNSDTHPGFLRMTLARDELEDEPTEGPTTVKIQVKLPKGLKRIRRFNSASVVDQVVRFVAREVRDIRLRMRTLDADLCHGVLSQLDESVECFDVIASYPARSLKELQYQTIAEARLGNESVTVRVLSSK